MARLIMLALIVGGVVWIVKRMGAARVGTQRSTTPRFESTVRCRECGAYVAYRHAYDDGDGPRCRVHAVETDHRPR